MSCPFTCRCQDPAFSSRLTCLVRPTFEQLLWKNHREDVGHPATQSQQAVGDSIALVKER